MFSTRKWHPVRSGLVFAWLIVLIVGAQGPVQAATAIKIAGNVGAWAITFFLQVMIGTLAFYVDKTQALFEIYLGVFAVLSGYLIPLRMLPEWAQDVAAYTPFRYVLAFPVETLMGFYDRAEALRLLGVQWIFVAGVYVASHLVWRAGISSFGIGGTNDAIGRLQVNLFDHRFG